MGAPSSSTPAPACTSPKATAAGCSTTSTRFLIAVQRPDYHEKDPRPGRERFYRENALRPGRWLRVVIDFQRRTRLGRHGPGPPGSSVQTSWRLCCRQPHNAALRCLHAPRTTMRQSATARPLCDGSSLWRPRRGARPQQFRPPGPPAPPPAHGLGTDKFRPFFLSANRPCDLVAAVSDRRSTASRRGPKRLAPSLHGRAASPPARLSGS